MTTQLRTWAAALGGDVSGRGVICPGPGHSTRDRSLSVTPSAASPDGFLVQSSAGDDPIACKDYVRTKLDLPEFKPNGHAKPAKKKYFDYRDETAPSSTRSSGRIITTVAKRSFSNGSRTATADGSGTSMAFVLYLIDCRSCLRLSPMAARSSSSKARPRPICFGAGTFRRHATAVERKSGGRSILPI